MHPIDKNELVVEAEDPDFDQEKVWKKIFKRVECDHCSEDGNCGFWDGIYSNQEPQKCSKWDDLSEPCRISGVPAGTVSIGLPHYRGAMTWGPIGTISPVAGTYSLTWSASYGT